MTSPPIEDGGVLVSAGRIVAAGPFEYVRKDAPAQTVIREHPSAALMPGLVNPHTHLELSSLAGEIPFPQKDFPSWLKELFALKNKRGRHGEEPHQEAFEKELPRTGTRLWGDVCNELARRHKNPCPPPGHPLPLVHTFHEVLGFNRGNLEDDAGRHEMALFRQIARKDEHFSLGAHAPYSTSPSLIREAKEWCHKRHRPFTIHCAEHPEEMEFLLQGRGFCRRLLEDLGRWNPRWKPPGCSPVKYLHDLGVLDDKTILVHAVHLDEEDWQYVSRARANVCFCPRSNANIHGGRPHMAKALSLEINCALGTDSLASNEDLSLFSEAVHALENHEGLDPPRVLQMITVNGAAMLQRAHEAGSLQKGASGVFLAVTIPEPTHPSHLAETILYQGQKGAWQWACTPKAN